jgi:uncharacterized protein (DUF433 family)
VTPAARRSAFRQDIRDDPAYTTADAARYLKLSPATLRSWFAGRGYSTSRGARHWQRLIAPASREPLVLSFWNLIEAHVLWALRVDHRVSIAAVRTALRFSQNELGIDRLLLRKELFTDARSLFLRQYGQLIDLSASGQIAMEQVLDAHLKRVEWDERKFPIRLYPFLPAGVPDESQLIAIDPVIAFGRPILRGKSVTTSVLADRVDAGESLTDIAKDYDLTLDQVERAIMYERAA